MRTFFAFIRPFAIATLICGGLASLGAVFSIMGEPLGHPVAPIWLAGK